MCGIAGQISWRGAVNPGTVHALTEALRHRGPDDGDVYFHTPERGASVGLGHRRLSIIDLSADGRQPMTNEDGSLRIVFNGEIYNFQELRRELGAKGHRFRSRTDTEVLLHLYEEYGTACLSRLRGMFAFALWDDRRQRLFAGRDRMGKKPFYYAHRPDGFFFASEIQALYEVPSVRRDVDPTALRFYMAFSYIPSPWSIFRDIRKLPPAHSLVLEGDRMEISPYWRLRYAPKEDMSFEEAREALMEKLGEATRIRLCSDVPLGCFLSGGIDSSLVAALMTRYSDGPVRTFSIGFPEADFDESGYARRVAAHLGTEHTEFEVRPRGVEILPEVVRHYGEPYADSSALPTWYLSELTRQHVTVALNGDGGDELFAGYDWYGTAGLFGRAGNVLPPPLCRWMSSLFSGQAGGSGWGRKAYRFFELAAMTPASRFQHLRQLLQPNVASRLYLPGAAPPSVEVARYVEEAYLQAEAAEDLDRMLFADCVTYLPEELLVKVDRATMAHGLEGRSPLLDHELAEFAATLPAAYKRKGKEGKNLLRACLRELVPPELFERPKMGFSVPLDDWFRGDLKSYLRRHVLEGRLQDLDVFDMVEVRTLLGEHENGAASHGSLLWRLLMLSQWMDAYAP